MTYDKDGYIRFSKLLETKLVRFGNNEQGEGVGVGDIKAMVSIGKEKRVITLKDVLYVPTLKRKLFSISATTKYGHQGIISKNAIILKDSEGNTKLIGRKQSGLYRVELEELSTKAYAASTVDNLTLWHRRLAHVNRQVIQTMVKEQSVIGLKPFRDIATM